MSYPWRVQDSGRGANVNLNVPVYATDRYSTGTGVNARCRWEVAMAAAALLISAALVPTLQQHHYLNLSMQRPRRSMHSPIMQVEDDEAESRRRNALRIRRENRRLRRELALLRGEIPTEEDSTDEEDLDSFEGQYLAEDPRLLPAPASPSVSPSMLVALATVATTVSFSTAMGCLTRACCRMCPRFPTLLTRAPLRYERHLHRQRPSCRRVPQ